MPEFDVAVLTLRSGTHGVLIVADDAEEARRLVQAECDLGGCHCPPESWSDDVESAVLNVRQVGLRTPVLLPTR